jgi:hypoxanthine phosphoribosyltransferase
MKLNDYKILIIIFCIFFYHYAIQNSIEKLFFDLYVNYDIVKRPNKICTSDNYINFRCLGLPSRHAELTTLLFTLLYFTNWIRLPICIFFIFFISLQRIVINMHTLLQVCVAILFGFVYSQIYLKTHFSIYSFFLVFIIGLSLIILSIDKIDKKLEKPIPNWVNKEMIKSIDKKRNTPYYIKIMSLYANAYQKGVTFISWDELEGFLDIMIERIKSSNIQFDGVVGIKTGGAIISDYVSNKLGLPNYKIKLARSEYNCDKKPINMMNDILQKRVLNEYGKYTICEEINENLDGKNIILIDELVSSGTTMIETIKYLRNEKHVNIIYPTCIALSKQEYKQDIHIHSILQSVIFVWPWGYDN